MGRMVCAGEREAERVEHPCVLCCHVCCVVESEDVRERGKKLRCWFCEDG